MLVLCHKFSELFILFANSSFGSYSVNDLMGFDAVEKRKSLTRNFRIPRFISSQSSSFVKREITIGLFLISYHPLTFSVTITVRYIRFLRAIDGIYDGNLILSKRFGIIHQQHQFFTNIQKTRLRPFLDPTVFSQTQTGAPLNIKKKCVYEAMTPESAARIGVIQTKIEKAHVTPSLLWLQE